MCFQPLNPVLFLGVTAVAKDSSAATPFYLRPFAALRGVQAMKCQGGQATEAEAEVRWYFHLQRSAVGFGGIGAARS